MDAIKKFSANPRLTGLLWLVLRLGIGYQWIESGWKKVTSPAWTGTKAPSAIHGFLTGTLSKTGGDQPAVFGWYASTVRGMILPNEHLFSTVVAYGELLVGIALVLGLFTKWAAFWGAFMNLNYVLAGSASANGYMLVADVCMLFAGAGLTYYALDRFVLPFLERLLTGPESDAERAPRRRLAGGRISSVLSGDYRRMIAGFCRTDVQPHAQVATARSGNR